MENIKIWLKGGYISSNTFFNSLQSRIFASLKIENHNLYLFPIISVQREGRQKETEFSRKIEDIRYQNLHSIKVFKQKYIANNHRKLKYQIYKEANHFYVYSSSFITTMFMFFYKQQFTLKLTNVLCKFDSALSLQMNLTVNIFISTCISHRNRKLFII